jgi:hypothetical protein
MMSRAVKTAAVMGMGAALALAFTGSAQAVEPAGSRAAPPHCGANTVTVYQKKNFTGQRTCLTKNYKNLASYTWGNGAKLNDSISSVFVPANCWLTLYQNKNYGGKKSVWKRKSNYGTPRQDGNLSNNTVGDNKASSLKAGCSFDT